MTGTPLSPRRPHRDRRSPVHLADNLRFPLGTMTKPSALTAAMSPVSAKEGSGFDGVARATAHREDFGHAERRDDFSSGSQLARSVGKLGDHARRAAELPVRRTARSSTGTPPPGPATEQSAASRPCGQGPSFRPDAAPPRGSRFRLPRRPRRPHDRRLRTRLLR